MITLSLKQGATFQASAAMRTADGARVRLTGCALSCRMRDSLGNAVAALTCTQPVNVPWVINLTYGGSTAAWAPGRYFADLAVTTADGATILTETFAILVNPSSLGASA